MPRQARKESGTGIYHVMLRGINRQDIFEDAEDYMRMLRCMQQMLEQYVNVLFPASGNQYKCLPLWQKTKVTKLCQ